MEVRSGVCTCFPAFGSHMRRVALGLRVRCLGREGVGFSGSLARWLARSVDRQFC